MNIYDISHQISQLPLAHFLPKPVRHRVKPGRSSQKSFSGFMGICWRDFFQLNMETGSFFGYLLGIFGKLWDVDKHVETMGCYGLKNGCF